MSENQEIKLRIPFCSSLPSSVATDDNLPDSVKIYWSQVYALCSQKGYCLATDSQLSDMKGVSIKTIERWNKILEDNGHIKRKTKNIRNNKFEEEGGQKWTKRRKIYCILKNPEIPIDEEDEEDFSKKDSGTLTNEGTVGTLTNEGTVGTLTNEGYKREVLSENSKEENEFSCFLLNPDEKEEPLKFQECLNLLELDLSSKKKISNEHSPEKIEIAVKRTLAWKTRINDQSGIFAIFKNFDTWTDVPTVEDKIEAVNNFMESLRHLDETYIGQTRIVVGNKYIEFVCGPKSKVFDVEDHDFKKKTIEYLEFLRKISEK